MASEYTTNRRYPLYTDQDKPNLRDQYNGAIRMIDGDMDDALDASGHVSDALGAGFDAQHTVRMALDDANAKFGSGISSSSTVTDQLNNKANQTSLADEVTARQNADTSLSNRLGNGVTEQNTATAQLTALSNRLGSGVTEQNTATAQLATKASQTSLDGVADRVTVLEAKKKMVVIGDSFSDFNDGSAVATMWPTLVANALNLELHNYAKGGSGFCVGGANIFSQQVALAVSQISDKDSVAKVFVFGGINDAHAVNVTGGNLMDAATPLLATLTTNFAKAEIIVAGICPTRNADRAGNNNTPFNVSPANAHRYDMLTEYLAVACSGAASAARKAAIKFINFRNFTYFFDGFFQSNSNWHPSLIGHMGIASKMLGGTVVHDSANLSNNLALTAHPTYINKAGTVYTANAVEVAITGPDTAQISISMPGSTVGTGSTQPVVLLNGFPSAGAFLNLYTTTGHKVLTCAGDGPAFCRNQYRIPDAWDGDGFRILYDVSM